jgi:hypothetical protein
LPTMGWRCRDNRGIVEGFRRDISPIGPGHRAAVKVELSEKARNLQRLEYRPLEPRREIKRTPVRSLKIT